MPVVTKEQLKTWFSNLKKPPEGEFWSWIDSYRHILDKIPMIDITGLISALQKKADLVDGVVPEDQLPFSVVTSEVIALGKVSVVGNKTNLDVHSSGANKVRVKGQLITRAFPNEWTITPVVADGTKVLRGYAVKGELDFFLAEGPELPDIVDPEIPEGALEIFNIRMNIYGATIVVPASGNKLKEESNWSYVEIKSNATPTILEQPLEVRGSFYLTKSLGIGIITIEGIKKLSLSTVFKDYFYGGREMLLFNATGGNIIIDSSGATDPDSYFFSNRITPFTLKNNTGILVKMRGDVIELLSPFALQSDLATEAATRLANDNTEIVNRAIGDANLQTQVNTNNASITDLYIHQITIVTTTSINTNTLGAIISGGTANLLQHGRNVKISNGVNAINLSCETTSAAAFVASYTKLGSAAITFTAGSGATLVLLDGTAILNGAVGSTACLTRSGNTFYLQISNR